MVRKMFWILFCLVLISNNVVFSQESSEYIILDDYPIHDAPNEDGRQLALTGVSFIDVRLNFDVVGELIIENGWAQVTFTTPSGREILAWIPQNALQIVGEAVETPTYAGDFVIVDGERIEVNEPFLFNGEARIGEIVTFDEIRASFHFLASDQDILNFLETPDGSDLRIAYRAVSVVFVGFESQYGFMRFAIGPDEDGVARTIIAAPSGAQGYRFNSNQSYILGSVFDIDMSQSNFAVSMTGNGLTIGDNVILFAYTENTNNPDLTQSERFINSPNLNPNGERVSTLEMLECFTSPQQSCDITNPYTLQPNEGALVTYLMWVR